MKEQNYSNHARFVPLFHGALFLMIVASLIFSAINLTMYFKGHVPGNWHGPVTLFTLCVSMTILYAYARMFATKVQDRAIRAEENLRHFALTGKLLDSRITMSQVIALRFAPDQEFPTLAIEAANKNLSKDEIKKQIKIWKADHNRV